MRAFSAAATLTLALGISTGSEERPNSSRQYRA